MADASRASGGREAAGKGAQMTPSQTLIVLLVLLALIAAVLTALLLRLRARTDASAATEAFARLERHEAQLDDRDERLTRRETTLETKAQTLELREGNLLERERSLEALRAEVDDLQIAQRKRLEEIADYTAEEARQALLAAAEDDARHEAMILVRDLENRAREEGMQRARRIVATAIQRVAAEVTASATVSSVHLADDDMKGRIIGREGRNVRAFEQITGVNVVIDDSPGVVTLSSFDPVRREVARLALERLVQDGRIHPSSIESAYEHARERVGVAIGEAGNAAVEEARVTGLVPDLVRLLGQLHYRTSYGQNVLAHSVETALIAGMMASELGTDPALARRCGLLHDIGKALTHEVEGSHACIGAAVAERLSEPAPVQHAIAAHHGEVEPRSVEAVLTQAADAVSASRPGARKHVHEQYITRLRRIEELCGGFAGVEKVYAMQSGRDVRVIVCPDQVDDARARILAKELAGCIESELAYPGQIRVTVIRELRAHGTAH